MGIFQSRIQRPLSPKALPKPWMIIQIFRWIGIIPLQPDDVYQRVRPGSADYAGVYDTAGSFAVYLFLGTGGRR
jgi:hypothetical protein